MRGEKSWNISTRYGKIKKAIDLDKLYLCFIAIGERRKSMLMTATEYIESLRKLNTRVYMFGEKVDNWVDHPIIRPSINCVAMTYALAQDAETAWSEDSVMLPEMRGNGRVQRDVFDDVRDR